MNFEAKLRAVFAEEQERPWSDYGGYTKYMQDLWNPIVELMKQLGAPTAEFDHNGAGTLISVGGENPLDYVWLGADEEMGDGPWLPTKRDDIRYVGGAHYFHKDIDSYESYSDVVWEEVTGDPLDDYALAEAFVACWRKARDAELIYDNN